MLHFIVGKQEGVGSWNLTFPHADGCPGFGKQVRNCKNESTFWDCLAQQVRVGAGVFMSAFAYNNTSFVF